MWIKKYEPQSKELDILKNIAYRNRITSQVAGGFTGTDLLVLLVNISIKLNNDTIKLSSK